MAPLQLNATGSWVRELQKLLFTAGFTVANSGIFNEETQNAVKAFQLQKSLSPTGISDEATWKALGWSANSQEKLLTESDLNTVAHQLSVEVAAMKAVYEVESRGKGFLPDGRPKILFEGHIFWSQLKKRGKDPAAFTASNEDILFPKWTKEYYKGNAAEYERLSRAQTIDHEAALASASWGTFQIMGFNFKLCGYDSVLTYIDSSYRSEGDHLKAFAAFITSAGLLPHLKNKNWAAFAKGYNGPAYQQNQYDLKLEAAYKKHTH